jgi:hypothetical protein
MEPRSGESSKELSQSIFACGDAPRCPDYPPLSRLKHIPRPPVDESSVRDRSEPQGRRVQKEEENHEMGFYGNANRDGWRRRIYAWLCTRRHCASTYTPRRWAWTWWWLRAQSHHSLGSIAAAGPHFREPHSSAAGGTYSGTSNKQAGGAAPTWRTSPVRAEYRLMEPFPLMAHRDVSLRGINSVAIGGIADMPGAL